MDRRLQNNVDAENWAFAVINTVSSDLFHIHELCFSLRISLFPDIHHVGRL